MEFFINKDPSLSVVSAKPSLLGEGLLVDSFGRAHWVDILGEQLHLGDGAVLNTSWNT